MSKRITDYQLLDHGIDHCQYFQGCGTAFTEYNHVETGCGDNFAEALDDCLEQIAMVDDIDTESLELLIKDDNAEYLVNGQFPVKPSVSDLAEKATEEECFDEHYYYVSIRYNLE